ncbi:MAG: YagK/YfjJ domain-containing protein [Shewanella sp.]
MAFRVEEQNSRPYAGYGQHIWPIVNEPIDKLMLNSFIRQLEKILSHYSKVLLVRIDLHPLIYSPDNRSVQHVLREFSKMVRNSPYSKQLGIICVRERVNSHKEHYHLVLMLNGNKIQKPDYVLHMLKELWQRRVNGSVHLVENSYYRIERGQSQTIFEAIYRLSYLAKQRSKERDNPKASKPYLNTLPWKGNSKPKDDRLLVALRSQ